jgi:hypothetical protein
MAHDFFLLSASREAAWAMKTWAAAVSPEFEA